MKKAIVLALCLLSMGAISGCTAEERNSPEPLSGMTVRIVNSVKDGNIWILPQTEENLKTTLWGTATAADVEVGEVREAVLSEAGEDGLFIFRMIDVNKFYYSADGILIEDGRTVEIKGDDIYSLSLEVTDGSGTLTGTYEVFGARL